MSTTSESQILLNHTDRIQWNDFVRNSPSGHVMQSWEWGEFKQAMGWQVDRIAIAQSGKIMGGAQLLLRRLPGIPFTIAYLPKGPVVDITNCEIVPPLLAAIHQIARRNRVIFLKIEPELANLDQFHRLLTQHGFWPTRQTNQPRSTIILDLSQGEENLLAQMRPKTRQLIRRAKRNGVKIVQGTDSDLEAFYQIVSTTARLKNITGHHKNFYQEAWKPFKATNSVQLFLARYENEVVAAKMIVVFGNKSIHLWGGTSPLGREINASYLIQWESIKWAISQGCRYCDLWGIPDEIATLESQCNIPKGKHSGFWGVYNFKRGFGGEITSYVGAYDYPYHQNLYRLLTKLFEQRKTLGLLYSWQEKITGNMQQDSSETDF